MAQKVGVGVVGAGSIGIRGALAHFALPDVQDRTRLVAVCDPVPGRAQAAAEQYGVARHYLSEDELFADRDVDMVILCSPIGLHHAQGVKAINAGKHVHFNKTMTTTSVEALELIALSKARGVHLVASPGQMLRRVNHTIRDLVRSGALGKLSWAVAGAAFGAYHEQEAVRGGDTPLSNINPSWYWRKPGGGPMYDMTVYALHSLTGVLGPVRRVAAMSGVGIATRVWRGQSFPCDADDNTLAIADFGDNVFALVHGTFAGMVSEFGMPSYFGERGHVTGLHLNGKPIEYPGLEQGLTPSQTTPHATGPHRDMEEMHVFEDSMQLVRWILTDKPSIASAEHAAHVIEVIEASYRAAQTGQTQTLETSFALPEDLVAAV